jgi:hypothetical protein
MLGFYLLKHNFVFECGRLCVCLFVCLCACLVSWSLVCLLVCPFICFFIFVVCLFLFMLWVFACACPFLCVCVVLVSCRFVVFLWLHVWPVGLTRSCYLALCAPPTALSLGRVGGAQSAKKQERVSPTGQT